MTNEYENPLVTATPPPEPVSEEQLAINFLNSLRIHAKDHYDKPNFTLYKNGIGFAPLGNIMAICAEAKNGKSWLMQQFVLAMLKGEFCGLTSNLQNPNVLYFDTEQDKYDTKMIQTRVHYVMDWKFEEDNDAFQLYSMDDFDLLKKDKTIQANRMFAIETAIQVMKPTVVFIDGVRDLIFDFNDLSESATLVQKLMSLARRNNILICTVLHVNPNSDKMRGHLGTEMQNKTTDVFTVKKEEEAGIKVFKVKQITARHMDVEDWKFWINDNGKFHLPELVEEGEAEVVESKQNTEWKRWSDEEVANMVRANLSQGETVSFTTLRERIRKMYSIGASPSKDAINIALTSGSLICSNNRYALPDAGPLMDSMVESDNADPF